MHDTRFDALLDEMCADWGYCGCLKYGQSLHVTSLIPPSGPVTADQFVDWLLLADNLNPSETTATRKAELRAVFVRHMGADIVDASELRWSDVPHDEEAAEAADAKFRGRISGN